MAIYLDNAATSYPKPEEVYRGMESFVRASGANPGRGGHRRAVEAEAMIDETRLLLARLFGVPRPERIVFAHNATDGLNMAIKGVLRPGDHAITSVLEHNSVSRPLNQLEKEGLIALTRLPASAEHLIDPDEVRSAIRPNTRLVALTQASNVTGTIQPTGAIGPIVRERGALFLVDAAQSAGVLAIDVTRPFSDRPGPAVSWSANGRRSVRGVKGAPGATRRGRCSPRSFHTAWRAARPISSGSPVCAKACDSCSSAASNRSSLTSGLW